MVTKSRWGRVKTAVESLWDSSTAHLTLRLQRSLGSDPELLEEACRLLAGRSQIGDFMEGAEEGGDPKPALNDGVRLANRYTIRKFIGAGAMGEVYEAADDDMHDLVALKLLRPSWAADTSALARFRSEIKLSRQVQHPNVCRVHDLCLTTASEIGNVAFLTMELLDGETLDERLRRGPLEMDLACEIAIQVLDALGAAHAQGVLHLDLKCSNIFLVGGEKPRRAVITDFGLARSFSVSGSQTLNNLAEGITAGTPAYMAPEQYCDGPYSAATDLHALGVVLFRMATGRFPFPAHSALGAAVQRLNGRAPSPRMYREDLEEKWERTILRCLESQPQRRPQSAAEVRSLLLKPVGRTRHRWIAGAAAFAILAAGAALLATRKPENAISPEAQRHVALGNEFLQGRNNYDFRQALAEFQKAQSISPKSELPWIGIAEAESSLVNWGLEEPAAGLPAARQAARRAVALNAKNARAEGISGYVDSIDVHSWRLAEPHFVRALSLDPANGKVLLWHAAHLSRSGKQAEAIRELQKALAGDPANFLLHQQLATAYFRSRDAGAFLQEAKELARLQPLRGNAHLTLARASEFAGNPADALKEWEAARKYDTDEEQLLSVRAQIYCGQGEFESARSIASRIEGLSKSRLIEFAGLASIYARIGDPPLAIDALERGFDRDDSSVLLAPVIPYLDSIHDQPGYRAFLKKLGLP